MSTYLDLEKFKAFNLVPGTPSITITKNGVGFSKNAVFKLNKSKYVRILINYDEKQIVVQECGDDMVDKVDFVRDFNNPSARWNSSDLLNTIQNLMSWDLEKNGYKIEGDYYQNQNLLLFDLKKAEMI